MRWFLVVLLASFAFCQAGATVFAGGGVHELMQGDSLVLENNSSILASTVSGEYVYLEFFGPYNVRKFALDLFAKDFGNSTRLEVVGLKFSAQPVAKPGGIYAVRLNASVLKANLALKTQLNAPRAYVLGESVRVSDLVSGISIENTGELTLQHINTVFQLLRNGEEIFYSENVSAAESLAPGETAVVRAENASWPLTPANPSTPNDNFSVKITVARNQFEETDYADNEIVIPINYAVTAPTAAPTVTALPTPVEQPASAPSAAPAASAAPAGGEGRGGDLLLLGAVAFLALLVIAAGAVAFGKRPPGTVKPAGKPKKG